MVVSTVAKFGRRRGPGCQARREKRQTPPATGRRAAAAICGGGAHAARGAGLKTVIP